MLTQDAVILKVKRYVNELISIGVPIEKAILFGSFAKGNPHEYSDIDVALVSPNFSGFGFEDKSSFSSINIKKEYIDIEVKTYESNYFKLGDPFITEIKNTGIEVL